MPKLLPAPALLQLHGRGGQRSLRKVPSAPGNKYHFRVPHGPWTYGASLPRILAKRAGNSAHAAVSYRQSPQGSHTILFTRGGCVLLFFTPPWDLLIGTHLPLISLFTTSTPEETAWSALELLLISPPREDRKAGEGRQWLRKQAMELGCWLGSPGSATWQLVMWMTANSLSSSVSTPVKCWLKWGPP